MGLPDSTLLHELQRAMLLARWQPASAELTLSMHQQLLALLRAHCCCWRHALHSHLGGQLDPSWTTLLAQWGTEGHAKPTVPQAQPHIASAREPKLGEVETGLLIGLEWSLSVEAQRLGLQAVVTSR